MSAPGHLHGHTRGGVERAVVWLVAIAVVAALVGSVVLYPDAIGRDVPDARFDVAFDEESRTIVVEHAGGDAITDRTTRRLWVVVGDASAGTATNVTWASDAPGPTTRGSGFPVTVGDQITIDDPSIDADNDDDFLDADAFVGFHLVENDTVRVVWQGSRVGGPVRTVTLANATLG